MHKHNRHKTAEPVQAAPAESARRPVSGQIAKLCAFIRSETDSGGVAEARRESRGSQYLQRQPALLHLLGSIQQYAALFFPQEHARPRPGIRVAFVRGDHAEEEVQPD